MLANTRVATVVPSELEQGAFTERPVRPAEMQRRSQRARASRIYAGASATVTLRLEIQP